MSAVNDNKRLVVVAGVALCQVSFVPAASVVLVVMVLKSMVVAGHVLVFDVAESTGAVVPALQADNIFVDTVFDVVTRVQLPRCFRQRQKPILALPRRLI